MVWYKRILRIVCLSPRVEEPNSEVKKLINVRTCTTLSSPVNVLCISLYLNLYMCRWIEISLWLWYGYGCEYTTIPGQSGPGSDGNEEVLHILQSSSVTGASQSDFLVSYTRILAGGILPLSAEMQSVLFYSPSRLGHSLVESYSSAEMQSVYSTAPAYKTIYHLGEWNHT